MKRRKNKANGKRKMQNGKQEMQNVNVHTSRPPYIGTEVAMRGRIRQAVMFNRVFVCLHGVVLCSPVYSAKTAVLCV